MPTFDYASVSKDVVKPLLKEFGSKRSFFEKQQGVYDPATGTGGSVILQHDLNCVIVPISRQHIGNSLSDGTLISTGMRYAYIEVNQDSAVDVGNWTVNYENSSWRVMDCLPLNPGNVIVLYTCVLVKNGTLS